MCFLTISHHFTWIVNYVCFPNSKEFGQNCFMKTASKAVIAGIATIATVSAFIKWYRKRNGKQSVTDACRSSVIVGNRPVIVVRILSLPLGVCCSYL